MNVLGWAANLLGQNPSLPSGAIDVIAIRQLDGSLTCSPFHVKLGRTCKKGEKKLVKLRVNGKDVDVCMRLGPAGEAFFLKRTREIEYKDSDALADDCRSPVELAPTPCPPEEIRFRQMSLDESISSTATRNTPFPRCRSLSESHMAAVSGADEMPAGSGKFTAPQNDCGMARERSVSDMSHFEAKRPATPKALEGRADLAAADGSSSLSSSGMESAAPLPPQKPAASGVSWIWRWGSLPVKSTSNLQLALEQPRMDASAAEGKHGTVDALGPNRLRRITSEVRETFDDWQERIAGDKDELSRCNSIAAVDNCADVDVSLCNSPDRPTNLSTSALGKYHMTAEHAQECRECAEDIIPIPLSHAPLPVQRHFRALALCGDKLSGSNAPQSAHELMELLYAHRVTEEMFLTLSESLLSDSRLVVIADDHLLNVHVAKSLLASAGIDPFSLQSEQEGSSSGSELRQIQAQSVQEAISLMQGLHEAPAWLGLRISSWQPSVNEADVGQSEVIHPSVVGFPTSTSHTSLAFFTPTRDRSFELRSTESSDSEMFGTAIRQRSAGSVEDFSTWSSVSIGWQESFADLADAFRLQQRNTNETARVHNIGLTASTSGALARRAEAMGSIAEERAVNSQDPHAYDHDGYFFHHESSEELDTDHQQNVRISIGSADGSIHDVANTGVVQDVAQEVAVSSIAVVSLVAEGKEPNELDPNSPLVTIDDSEIAEGETDGDQISLQDIAFEDISPEPADGDFYESDTDSYLSLSLDDDRDSSSNNLTSRTGSSLASLSIFGKVEVHANKTVGVNTSAAVPRRSKFRRYRYKKVLVPSKEQLELFNLKDGQNELVFELDDCPPLITQLYLWPADAKIVVTDIEGIFMHSRAATSSGWSSLLDYGKRGPVYQHDIINYFRGLNSQGYRVLYIADSPSALSNNNTNYSNAILSTVQNSLGQRLPQGPVFKSPDSLIRQFGPSRTEVFKAAALRGVRSLFPSNCSPFYAAFASRESDVVAFERNSFPTGRIFLVARDGKLRRILQNRNHSVMVAELQELMAQIFPKLKDGQLRIPPPPIQANDDSLRIVSPISTGGKHMLPVSAASTPSRAMIEEENFSDYSFWKLPIPTMDEL